ncbi:guanine nucleotide-binding protein (G protein), subunit alpha [Oopsacas minuta]|uniref:Guanine nucleotide-binding protein (G protein), subunit alpha n=1 Tax=Oopsacas minuta TaxID=111878 RepID=A0AAV7K7J6_9METZ|nr:guanine nucleotide-binding protein (G protein), subunit alpha [Oopsacas minuta]
MYKDEKSGNSNHGKVPGVKQCFEKRNKFQISDSEEYFLDALDRVKEDDYNPTREDIVRVRLKTVGIHEYNFNIYGQNFLVVDVGGQRGERRKWISSFENVQSVIFLTAISEYDQVLAETEKDDNRLLESLQLFETIIKYPWFKNAMIVVFFNKFDLFEKKILTSNLEEYFPYEGGQELYKNRCSARYMVIVAKFCPHISPVLRTLMRWGRYS